MKLIQANHRFTRNPQKRRVTNRVIVHHQAGNPVPASTMHQWHLDRGWLGIGYHYVIQPDGRVETGRMHDTQGSHAQGANADSIGICFAGNIDRHPPTDNQVQAFAELYQKEIKPRYGQLPISGHRDHGNTSCPGRHMPMKELIQMAMNENTVLINNRKIDAPVKNEGGRLYILLDGAPGERYWIQLRSFADLLGARLEWEAATKTAKLTVR